MLIKLRCLCAWYLHSLVHRLFISVANPSNSQSSAVGIEKRTERTCAWSFTRCSLPAVGRPEGKGSSHTGTKSVIFREESSNPSKARNHFSEIGVRNRLRPDYQKPHPLSLSLSVGLSLAACLSGFSAAPFYRRRNSEARREGESERGNPTLRLLRSFNPPQPR